MTEIFENGYSFNKALANPLSLTQITTKAGESLKSISDTQSRSHSSLETDSSFEISLGCLEKTELQKSLFNLTHFHMLKLCFFIFVNSYPFLVQVSQAYTLVPTCTCTTTLNPRRANIYLLYTFQIFLMNRKYIQPKKNEKMYGLQSK